MRTTAAVVVAVATALVVAGGVAIATRLPSEIADVVEDVEITQDGDNVLRGTLVATTADAVRLAVTLRSDEHELVITEDEATEDHEIPLLGVRPETRYEVLVGPVDGDQAEVGTLRTDALPADTPPVQVALAEPDRMAPGLTLFNQVYRPAPDTEGFDDVGFLTAVDETGAVVWYERDPLDIQDIRRQPNGDLLTISDETGARLFDPVTGPVGEWRGTSPGTPVDEFGVGLEDADAVVDVATHSMHHSIEELDDGSYLTLSRVEQEESYDEQLCDPSEDGDDDATPEEGSELLIGDSVVRFDPDSGEVFEELSFFDVLDPQDDPRKLAGDYCVANYMNRHYPNAEPRDWTHANAVELSPDGSTYLVSNRHTDELVALSAEDGPEGPAGSLLWQLGPDGDFELQGDDARWFWHQHAPQWLDDDTILVYDNGNGREELEDDVDAPYSRAAIYDIDTDAMTATQVWEHVTPERDYAFFLGDADLVDGPAGDNVLITHGGQAAPCEEIEDTTAVFGRIIEVERDSGEIVFDMTTRDSEGCVGWSIYRAERIEQIHPEGYTVEVVQRDG